VGNRKTGKMTPPSDTAGVGTQVCAITTFDEAARYKVANAAPNKSTLQFDGTDLNYLARVLFAEASGSESPVDAKTREREKLAIINVMYNRIGVVGFDPNDWVHGKYSTFKGVASAVKTTADGHLSGVQFASVIGADGSGTPKFKAVQGRGYESLKAKDCSDFNDCFEAIRTFLAQGPDAALDYDNFRAAGKGKPPAGQVVIGGNRFWKMKS
jgi:hypothetical protein